ncbi:unnamed protein product, partial [Staurois parvus]
MDDSREGKEQEMQRHGLYQEVHGRSKGFKVYDKQDQGRIIQIIVKGVVHHSRWLSKKKHCYSPQKAQVWIHAPMGRGVKSTRGQVVK